MNKFLLLVILLNASCHTNNPKIIADLPKDLEEVSGTETIADSDLIWMLNDSGNKPNLYGVSKKGNIKKELKIKAKNNDWEDLTSDKAGNLYIGDFGNNLNERENLAILKVKHSDLNNNKAIDIERISFYYPNQDKFPPKKDKMYFDCEAFFHFNDSLYLFTKSRVKDNPGKTDVYKIPATKGNHAAKFVGTFTTCEDLTCWTTSVDISDDGKQMALLTQKAVLVFSNFNADNFFSGSIETYHFNSETQKEGICFKNNKTLYITDERDQGGDGNLYELKLK
ncbi:hypothetical protein [Thalassobellus suaedae]|uniref:Uncharacterized protein n=1 Tax=Thalassobellus suaedae TaxID=3074124 RepID=A0ABY9Y5K2_9FLAO|nr:hypothetical protein RHP49_04430 [Flavobacteriaceae bacterium HL-DH10]